MSLKGEQIQAALTATRERLNRPMLIIETGTIRNAAPQYEEGDGHSTIVFCNHIAEYEGVFHSIDLEIHHCLSYLKDKGTDGLVRLIKGNSLDVLPTFDTIDFAYLDSANDAKNTLDEFLIVWPKIVPGGCVMVDDCNEASVELHKGDLLMPYLRNNGIKYAEFNNQIVIVK